MIVIGIDPGKNGGIAVLDCQSVYTFPGPFTDYDLLTLLRGYGGILTDEDDKTCMAATYIENVNAGPKMGSSAAFKFGQNVATIRMACLAAGLRIEYVSPQKWQRELGLLSKGRGLGQGDTEKKNRNKAKAQELFPGIKITHAIADALLIAEYGRRVEASRK